MIFNYFVLIKTHFSIFFFGEDLLYLFQCLFIYVQLINTSGCHLRITNCLKLLTSAELQKYV